MLMQASNESVWTADNGGDGSTLTSTASTGEEHESKKITLLANRRLISTTTTIQDEENKLAFELLKLKPLGLEIGNIHALQNRLEKLLFPANKQTKQDITTFIKNAEKMKAANISATSLRIGSWQIESKIEGDLVAKSYYAKKKLVWEYLEKTNKLKKKVEIQWNDISALRATRRDKDDYGVLEIELHNQPTFHDEDDPRPRKHTCWKPTADFTCGEGSRCRIHQLIFRPGYLERHYEKLISCDERLFQLNHKPFPSSNCPYFPSRQSNYTFENKIGPSLSYPSSLPPLQTQYHGEQLFQPFAASNGTTITSPVSVINYQQINENRIINHQLMELRNAQGMSRTHGNALPINQPEALRSLGQTYNYPADYDQGSNIPGNFQYRSTTAPAMDKNAMQALYTFPKQEETNPILYQWHEQIHYPYYSENQTMQEQLLYPSQNYKEAQKMQHQVSYQHLNYNENQKMQQQVHYPYQHYTENQTAQQYLGNNNFMYSSMSLPLPGDLGMQDFSMDNMR